MTVYELLAEYDAAKLEAHWPNVARLRAAILIARDLETCRQLLLGQPVPAVMVDRRELDRARRSSLVQLVRPIDQLEAAA